VTDVWQRPPDGPDLGPRQVIHIGDAELAQRVPGAPDSPITLRPLTGEACDLTALIFTFPPNYVGKVHWHPADTLYVVRKGTFIVEGEGAYNVGDIRWVKKGTPYGPESAGPEGCEVMLVAAGAFPLPTHDPDVDPPPSR
jgi:hypothetical protein